MGPTFFKCFLFRYLNVLCFLFRFCVYVSLIYDYIMLSIIGTSYDGHCPSSCLLLSANKLLSLSLSSIKESGFGYIVNLDWYSDGNNSNVM